MYIATAMTKAILELNHLEKLDTLARTEEDQGITAPSWVSEGIEIEYQQ
jgi:hypothetical protein